MERRSFFQKLGIGMATMAVVPSIALKEITKPAAISVDTVLADAWADQFMMAEMRLRLQLDHYILFGTVPKVKLPPEISPGIHKWIVDDKV